MVTFVKPYQLRKIFPILNKHGVYFYTKKVIVVVFKILCYLGALAMLALIYKIPEDIIKRKEVLSDTMSITSTLHIDEVTTVMHFLQLTLFVVALIFLIIGLVFGYTRRKDNRLRQASLLLENALAPTQKTV